MTLNNYKKYMIFQINQKYKKPNKSDVLEFQNISVSMISDSMGNLNTMDSGINMMFKDKKMENENIDIAKQCKALLLQRN